MNAPSLREICKAMDGFIAKKHSFDAALLAVAMGVRNNQEASEPQALQDRSKETQ